MELKQYLAERFTKRTAHCYDLMIAHYCKVVVSAPQARYKDVVDYLQALRHKGLQPRTVMSYLAAVKAYYDFLKATGRRESHPCKHLRLKDKLDHRVQVEKLFSSTELEFLLNEETEETRYNKGLIVRDKVILTLLVYQGLTTKNITGLEVEDLNLEQATVYIRKNNTLDARTLELHPKQIMLLNKYLGEQRMKLNRNGSTKLILTRRGNVETGCAIKGIIGQYKHFYPDRALTAHAIRKSVIANLLKSGRDIRLVQVFAGHRSPMATERYQQTGLEELTAAVMKFHPLG